MKTLKDCLVFTSQWTIDWIATSEKIKSVFTTMDVDSAIKRLKKAISYYGVEAYYINHIANLARERVENSPILSQYADIILYDWNEGLLHLLWVISAYENDIFDWAKDISDNANMELEE